MHGIHGTHSTRRRSLLGAAGALLALPGIVPVRAWGSTAWQTASPDSLGIDPDLAARLDQGVQSGQLPNLHAVVIARGGKLAVERYYEGTDERRGRPLGKVAFDATTLHDLRSVSKSVVGLLYGIALAERLVPALDAPVVQSFPAYADLLAREPRLRAILVSHVLSMTMGLDWNEDLPYTDARNSEVAMDLSPDRYRYVFERAVVSPPGQKWRYSGGATAILGHLIVQGARMPLLEYARTRLFAPLGIEHAEWTPAADGQASAASGLRLRAPDLARIGQLVLQEGAWNGRTVVPKEWLAASFAPRAEAFAGVQYGYQWYTARPYGRAVTMAIGLGGQRLVVMPSLDVAYVIFMGNYRRADQLNSVFAVQDLVHAAIR